MPFGSGGGGFNGGTVPGASVFGPSAAGTTALTAITPPGTGNAFLAVSDSANNALTIAHTGKVALQPSTNATVPLDVFDGNGDRVFQIDFDGTLKVFGATGIGPIKLQVFDNAGAEIFRVNNSGALQGKTGQALTFNL